LVLEYYSFFGLDEEKIVELFGPVKCLCRAAAKEPEVASPPVPVKTGPVSPSAPVEEPAPIEETADRGPEAAETDVADAQTEAEG
jgi:hypothetical protein